MAGEAEAVPRFPSLPATGAMEGSEAEEALAASPIAEMERRAAVDLVAGRA